MRAREPLSSAARRPERGFTLIEALVALLVLSVGLIGVAALHGQGLNASRTAFYRTQAVNLSADMADRIRLNRTAGTAYENAPADRNCDPNTGGAPADCSSVELAEHDLFVWGDLVAELLPDGDGSVSVDDTTTPTTYTITITWTEVGAGTMTHSADIQVPQF